jgi:glucose-1-phosphate adenylyltransferase
MILAGGKGSRLGPLTCHRAKPSTPFGGRYRIIDFALSNFVNSGYRRIYVLTQYMASSLIKHLSRNWRLSGFGEYIEVVPAQMRMGDHWYRGTADAVWQNTNLVRDSRAEHVAIFGGDHVYKFNIEPMEAEHRDRGADLTVAACPVPKAEASQFGVIQVDENERIIGFQEKPKNPTPIPGRPDTCLVSMGNYIFRSQVLQQALLEDAGDKKSSHDFGKDVIPRLVGEGKKVYIHDFGRNRVPDEPEGSRPYWRDVGTVESYVAANMEMRSPLPALNLYNRSWRIRTAQRDYPPARFVQDPGRRSCEVIDSLVCEGTIVSSALVDRSLIGYDCFVHADSTVQECLLMSGCDVGAGAQIRHVVMDKNCTVEPGATVGVDLDEDRRRFPFITDTGIVVLPKGTHVTRSGPIELAEDMDVMLRNDSATKEAMAAFGGTVHVSRRARHSYESHGPRYKRFGPGALRGQGKAESDPQAG